MADLLTSGFRRELILGGLLRRTRAWSRLSRMPEERAVKSTPLPSCQISIRACTSPPLLARSTWVGMDTVLKAWFTAASRSAGATAAVSRTSNPTTCPPPALFPPDHTRVGAVNSSPARSACARTISLCVHDH
jgi:hypothetical protein